MEDCAPAMACAAAEEADGQEEKDNARRNFEGTESETAGLLESGDDNSKSERSNESEHDGQHVESVFSYKDDLSAQTRDSHALGAKNKLVRDVMENAAGKEVVPSSEEITSNYITRTMMPCLSAIMSPFAFEVFATTIAVGSDNIAIYVAVFASEEYWEVAITIGLVLGMLYVWYFIANMFVQFELVKYICANYSQYLIAPLLVLLGLYVLSDSVLWDWMSGGTSDDTLDDNT